MEKTPEIRGGRPGHIIEKRSYAILILFALLFAGIAFLLYSYTQTLLKERLQEKLISLAATAAVQFNPEDIDAVRSENDLNTPAMERLVNALQGIRDANKDVQFAYLMRRTDNPAILSFIADADSLVPFEEWDTNGDEMVSEDEEIPIPGDPYPIEEYPVLRDKAFSEPSVDEDLQPDQWGLMMAAYAPIRDDEGNAIAIVGIDVLVGDYLDKVRATFLPFTLFILFLLFALTLMTLLLMRFWGERVSVMHEIDRQKDELLSIVSHQLAAPITSLNWYTELLLDHDLGTLSGEQTEHVRTMHGIVRSLTDLVSMILDVSRIQLGRMTVDKRNIELGGFFKEILDVIKPAAKEKGVKMDTEFPTQWPEANLDQRLTRMIIENLLTNAVKYTPSGGNAKISVRTEKNNLLCIVRDTGCGIPEIDRPFMFNRLFRASNVRDSIKGNGLGLYVAKGAAESQGGSIMFESEEGKGTSFIVVLPLSTPGGKKVL